MSVIRSTRHVYYSHPLHLNFNLSVSLEFGLFHIQEFSRQVTYSEGQHFAVRMNSLFIEASAKTSIGVSEAFQSVVQRILDIPELWTSGDKSSKSGKQRPGASSNSTEMPGTINLGDVQESDEYNGGCGC